MIIDKKQNPIINILPIYGIYNSSGKIESQINWNMHKKERLWFQILKQKSYNQGQVLEENQLLDFDIDEYVNNIKKDDSTNIEGTVAKMYFNRLFGKEFNRRIDNHINGMLNFGYAVLLSLINREIISNGDLTQIGVHHKNKQNLYNLSCDLMEIIRPFIDKVVYQNKDKVLDLYMKKKLINVLYDYCYIDNMKIQLYNAIPIYINSVFDYLDNKKDEIKVIKFG